MGALGHGLRGPLHVVLRAASYLRNPVLGQFSIELLATGMHMSTAIATMRRSVPQSDLHIVLIWYSPVAE